RQDEGSWRGPDVVAFSVPAQGPAPPRHGSHYPDTGAAGGAGPQYKATSLEKQHKHDLLTEPDLGVTIDLINPDTYRIDPTVLLDPADEKLLEEEIQAPTSSKRTMWINLCAQVVFDSDPAPEDTSGPAALEMMPQAMIRGMMDEEGNQFMAYFSPVEETLRKRDQEEEMDYAPEDVVQLSKQRARVGVQLGTNVVLVVKHRDMNEKELETQEVRRAQLENDEPEEEEEEEMEAEKEATKSVRKAVRAKGERVARRRRPKAPGAAASGAGGAWPAVRKRMRLKRRRKRKVARGAARDQVEIFSSDEEEEESEVGGSEGGPPYSPRCPRLSPSNASNSSSN
ncbi:RNA polymerase II-associated factor 1 homolog, partial [Strix uralensis]|uniref:RNA polymerase II-associated factor 1 homolog n=1 Tax=Strix uralensis TaxID=36305 RepID=UPI003DA729C4